MTKDVQWDEKTADAEVNHFRDAQTKNNNDNWKERPFDFPTQLTTLLKDGMDVLDVGAGPVSLFEKWKEKNIHVTATDILAEKYAKLRDELGYEADIETLFCPGECLSELFGIESFDVSFTRNALDHCIDPKEVVDQMMAVLRPGGFLHIQTFFNEGAGSKYQNMHQWNLWIDKNVLWLCGKDKSNKTNLTEHIEKQNMKPLCLDTSVGKHSRQIIAIFQKEGSYQNDTETI